MMIFTSPPLKVGKLVILESDVGFVVDLGRFEIVLWPLMLLRVMSLRECDVERSKFRLGGMNV